MWQNILANIMAWYTIQIIFTVCLVIMGDITTKKELFHYCNPLTPFRYLHNIYKNFK